MADPYALAEDLRQQLLALDERTARRMAAAYRDVYRAARDKVDYYIHRADAAQAKLDSGELSLGEFDAQVQELAASMFQTERWKQTSAELKKLVDDYARVARGLTTDAQGEAIDLGLVHTRLQLENELPAYAFGAVDDGALRAMVGFTANGAPLTELFRTLAPEAVALVTDTLRTGIGMGTNPGVLARQLTGPLGIPMWRALTIARTETLRAYRESQRATIKDSASVLEGWVWHSARDRRTCEVCWANDGTLFPITA